MQFEENQFGRPEIPCSQLRVAHLPRLNGLYSDDIIEFALTFDGYEHHPTTAFKINERAQTRYAANGALPRTLDQLRTCLFAQQRMWRDNEGPDEKSLEFITAIVGRIWRLVERRAPNA